VTAIAGVKRTRESRHAGGGFCVPVDRLWSPRGELTREAAVERDPKRRFLRLTCRVRRDHCRDLRDSNKEGPSAKRPLQPVPSGKAGP
jgi:hypothetical protein